LIPNRLGGIAQLFFSHSHVSVFRNPSPAPVLQYITSAQFCSVLFCSVHHFCSVLFISTSFLLSSVRSVQFCLVLFSHSVDTFSGYKPFTDAALQQSGSRQESEICNSFRNSVDTKPPRWHCSQLFFSQSHVSVFRNPSPAPVLQYITSAQFSLVQFCSVHHFCSDLFISTSFLLRSVHQYIIFAQFCSIISVLLSSVQPLG
jgi:transcriptional antiterminator